MKTARLLPVPLALLLALAGCSGSNTGTGPATPATPGDTAKPGTTATAKGATHTPLIGSMTIEPVGVAAGELHPGVRDGLKATATSIDPEGDGVSIDWQWLVNNEPVAGAISDQLAPGRYKKKDDVKVTAIARCTRGFVGPPSTTSVRIKNSPPEITSNPAVLSNYKVAVDDPDGDVVTFALEAPIPGFTMSADGMLTFDPKSAKEAEGKQLVIVAKDADGAFSRQSITIKF